MSQVQEFLNKFGSEQQKSNVKSPICIDQFDGGKSPRRLVTSDDDNSTCIYCDVDPDKFWEFLHSDKWNDSVILRVFPGELYNNLDFKMNEMITEDELAKHTTCAYVKVKSGTNRLGFQIDPETIRIEFTYYGKNLEKRLNSAVTTFTPGKPTGLRSLVTKSESFKGYGPTGHLTQTPEELQPHLSEHLSRKSEVLQPRLSGHLSQRSGELQPRLSGHLSQRSGELQPRLSRYTSQRTEEYNPLTRPKSRTPSPTARKFINISLGYYYSLNSLDIDDGVESDCCMLDIRRRGKLGLSRDTFGTSRTSIDDEGGRRKKGEQSKKVRSPLKRDKQREDVDTPEVWEGAKIFESWQRARLKKIMKQKELWAETARRRHCKEEEEEDWIGGGEEEEEEEEDEEEEEEEEDEEEELKREFKEEEEEDEGVGEVGLDKKKQRKKKIGKKKKGKEGTKPTKKKMDNTSKKENKEKKVKTDSLPCLYPVISRALTLRTMGKMLEREKHVNFNKMSMEARKKFIITDERILRMNRCVKKMKGKKKFKSWENIELSPRKHQLLFKRFSHLSTNLHEFALLVMGITDSVEMYRTVVWMGKEPNYGEGRWRAWFEARLRAKAACQAFPLPKGKNTFPIGNDEKRSQNEILNVDVQDDFMDRKVKTGKVDKAGKAGKAGMVGMAGKAGMASNAVKYTSDKGKSDKAKIDKSKADKSKIDRSKANESKIVKGVKKDIGLALKGYKAMKKYTFKPNKNVCFGKIKDGKDGKGAKDEGQEYDEEGDREEEYEEYEEEDGEVEEGEERVVKVKRYRPRRYNWEMGGDVKFDRIKPEISVPVFSLKNYVVRSKMILMAMDNFIIRKERVTSSKDRSFTSMAFIRPSFAQKLFQCQP